MNDVQKAILHEFLVESFDNLSNIHDDLAQYEKNPSDRELLNSIYRKIHTLKGSASFLGFKNLESITHTVESILDYIRDDIFSINTEVFDLFLESFDICNQILKVIEETGAEGEESYSLIINRLGKVIEMIAAPGEVVIKSDALVSGSDISHYALKDSGNMSSMDDSEEEIALQEEQNEEGAIVRSNPSETNRSEAKLKISDSIVRVNVNLLDKIMNVVGELVITRNQILQYSKVKDDGELNRFAQQLNTITTELQTDIMTTRMQPVGSVFNKFERVVRDLSRSQDKKVVLYLVGGETELDKTLIEVVKDPMTHLVRNALDHGLEKPDNRVAQGKDPEGRLEIKAYHEGGQVIIDISDDGAGINTERVRAKAVEKGILSAQDAQALPKNKVHSLIFHPGFSTAEQITNISGRGVGMDVVKSNIEKIGGEVEVDSKEGRGTTFKLKIPLTLAIVPALVIESGKETFAIHQKNLVELVLLEREDFHKIENLHGKEFFRLRGDLIPIVRLNEVLKIGDENVEPMFLNIIVLKAEGKTYGLIVDEILDTQEIVVKPLDRKLKNLSYYAGSTIMGDGRVALIIDAFGFYNHVDSQIPNSELLMRENRNKGADVNYDRMEVVLFRLGDNRTYGVPLSLIARLEEFPIKKIEFSGSQSLMRYRGSSMPLINLESLLNLKGESSLLSKDEEKLNCIVVHINGTSFGFVVSDIIDIAFSESPLETDTIDRKEMLGTVYIEEKLITILDVYKVVNATEVGRKICGDEGNFKLSGKVLVIEDSPLYRTVQSELLTNAGLEVFMANNGSEGLEIFKNNPDIGVILTDIEMPKLDGYQFTEKVREYNENVPIIALSSKVRQKDILHGEEVGMTKQLQKLNKKEVLETVEKYMGSKG